MLSTASKNVHLYRALCAMFFTHICIFCIHEFFFPIYKSTVFSIQFLPPESIYFYFGIFFLVRIFLSIQLVYVFLFFLYIHFSFYMVVKVSEAFRNSAQLQIQQINKAKHTEKKESFHIKHSLANNMCYVFLSSQSNNISLNSWNEHHGASIRCFLECWRLYHSNCISGIRVREAKRLCERMSKKEPLVSSLYALYMCTFASDSTIRISHLIEETLQERYMVVTISH